MGEGDTTATFDGGQAGKNTRSMRKIPIVMVPGVMGTRIHLEPLAGDKWDPDDEVGMGNWVGKGTREKLALLGIGANPNPPIFDKLNALAENEIFANKKLDPLIPANVGTDRANKLIFYTNRRWGQAVWTYYRDVIMGLETTLNTRGQVLNPVHVCGYDWRKSCDDSADRLRTVIKDVLSKEQAQKVILVTHSMGGLVARALMRKGGSSLIHGVVHCCMPSNGAPVAYRRFFTGISPTFDRLKHANSVPEALIQRLMGKVLGNTRLKWSLALSVMQGPNELLPADSFPALCLTDDNGRDNLATGINSLTPSQEYPKDNPPGIGVVPPLGTSELEFTPLPGTVSFGAADAANLRARLAGAAAFHTGFSTVAHPNTCLIMGGVFMTDQGFDWSKGFDRNDLSLKVDQDLNGDGTVPLASAEFRTAPQDRILAKKVVRFAEHSTCFSDGPFKKEFNDTVVDFVHLLLRKP